MSIHLDEVAEITAKKLRKTQKYWDDYTFEDLLNGKIPCFLAGTFVATESNYKPIETLKVGELVKTYNFNTKQVETQKILKTFVHYAEKHLVIQLENKETIKVTGQHRIWVYNLKKWKTAVNLTLKDTPI